MENQQISKTLHCGLNNIYTYNHSDLLGKGSQAKVFKGQSKCKQKVAIKIFQKTAENASILKEQFIRLCKLNHPNIVKVHQCIQTEHNIYYVMDLYNSDLMVYISTYRLEKFTVMTIFTQILDALVYLMSCKILYQDLSVENVLIKNKTPYLSDINIDPSHRFHNVFYIPPQLVVDQPQQAKLKYDQKSLTWSLGVLLYYMLHEKFPYPAKVNISQHKNNLRNILYPSIKLDESFKLQFPSISEILQKCLTYNREERIDLITLNTLPCLRKYRIEPSIHKSMKKVDRLKISTVASESSLIKAESRVLELDSIKLQENTIKQKFRIVKCLRSMFQDYAKTLKNYNIKLKIKVVSLNFLVLCKIRDLLREINVILAQNKTSHEAHKDQLLKETGLFNKYFQSFNNTQLCSSEQPPLKAQVFERYGRQTWNILKCQHQKVQSCFYQLLHTFQPIFDVKIQQFNSDSVSECVSFYLNEIKRHI